MLFICDDFECKCQGLKGIKAKKQKETVKIFWNYFNEL